MRNIFFLCFVILSTNVLALEPVDEQQIMLYYHIPLGAENAKQKEHQFGLRLDQTSHDPRETVHINMLERRQAAADFRFGYDGLQSLKIHGVEYAAYLVARAEASEEDVKVIEEQPAEEAVSEASPEVAAEETGTEQEAETEEEGAIQKKLNELPAGVILGVILGIGILAGIGG